MITLIITTISGILLMFVRTLPSSWLRETTEQFISMTLMHVLFMILLAWQIASLASIEFASWTNDLLFPLTSNIRAQTMMRFDPYAENLIFLATIVSYLVAIYWQNEPHSKFLPKASVPIREQMLSFYRTSDFSVLFFFLLASIVMVSAATNFMIWLIGIEILSMILYIFAASNNQSRFSVEAGYKYFISGSVATAFILLGIALCFRSVGSFDFIGLSQRYSFSSSEYSSFRFGILFLSLGIFQKISLIPLHFWSIDLYQGTPLKVTTVMITIAKLGYFAAFYRLLMGIQSHILDWQTLLGFISVTTMLIASVLAWKQTDFKRLIAYSSITYTGYFLLPVWMPIGEYSQSIPFLLGSYSLATLGIFAGLSSYFTYWVDKDAINLPISRLNTLARSRWTLVFIAPFFFSLAGIPPFAGFFAKVLLFSTALATEQLYLVAALLLSSLLTLAAYLKLLLQMSTYNNDLFASNNVINNQVASKQVASKQVASKQVASKQVASKQITSPSLILWGRSAHLLVLGLCLFALIAMLAVAPI